MMPTPEQVAAALAFADAFPGCNDVQTHLKVLAAEIRALAAPPMPTDEERHAVVGKLLRDES